MAEGGSTDPNVAVKVERKMKELIEQVKEMSAASFFCPLTTLSVDSVDKRGR